jgi:2-amino-4-hydroxy-6-hydroxymethyldihydropteridine diphosphokinase
MSGDVGRRYVLGIGANLGDRRSVLRAAVLDLGTLGRVRSLSSLYETAPVGPAQPDFLNAAVALQSQLAPEQLLTGILGVERRHGRERRERWGPRTLDIDLLYSPGLVIRSPGLTLPHPELCRRAFALRPLLDVEPDAESPESGIRYADVLATLEDQGLRRLETTATWDPRPNEALASSRVE